MKFCSNCGKELADNAQTCPNCGFVFGNAAPVGTAAAGDKPSFGIAFLSFLFPLIGLILYVIWKPATPLRAKSAGKGALIGIVVSAIFYIIAGALGALSY